MCLVTLALPLRESEYRISVVGADSIQDIEIAIRVGGVGTGAEENASASGIRVEKDVVLDRDQSGGLGDEQRPSACGGHVERVVKNLNVTGPGGGIDLIGGYASGAIVVEEVVAEDGILRAIHVDSRSPGSAV